MLHNRKNVCCRWTLILVPNKQPAKRRNATASTAENGSSSNPKTRPSKLAKEHGISAQEEAEIKEAFGLFSEPMDGEKEGVIPIGDVRRAMM